MNTNYRCNTHNGCAYPVPKTLLTDLTLRNLEPPAGGQTTYWDTGLAHFGIRISQGGAKTFCILVGPEHNRRRISIGRYPVISLQEARTEAKKRLAQHTLGTHNTTIGFAEGLKLFLETHCKQNNKPSTYKSTERLLRRHFLPRFQSQGLQNITTQDIAPLIDRLLRTPAEANHAYTAAKTFFRWAQRRRYIQYNPLEGLEKPAKSSKRERVLSDTELAKIIEGAQEFPFPFGTIVLLLLLTGQRRMEIGGMRREFIDPEEKTIIFPANYTKNNRQHVFPLGPWALEVVSKVPNGGALLFPGRYDQSKPYNGWAKSKRQFDAACGVTNWSLHDLRRTWATKAAEWRVCAPHITEMILNHVSGGTLSPIARVYNVWTYMPEMREAMFNYEQALPRTFSKEKT